MHKIRSTVAAVMLLAPTAAMMMAQPAAAQQRAVVAQPSITQMALNSDAGLSPGATLRVQVIGTPNARSGSLTLGNSGISIPLRQESPGSYAGSYVVRRVDSAKIDPSQLLTARLTFGDRTYSRQFNYPDAFQALSMGAAPAAAPRLAVERFVMRPMGRIEPGRELRFRLRGAPGADAWMDIPGVINGVDLAEVRPGVYEGVYTVRRRDNLDAFRNAVATLKLGTQRVTARLDLNGREDDLQTSGPGPRDERPPEISDLFPANGDRVGERGRTRIGARLADQGSGVDPASVQLRLNGRDVTADARISADEVTYRADLDPGRYTAEVVLRDLAGNSARKAWTFDVTPGGERERQGNAGPLPLEVTSHSNNMVIDARGNLNIQGRTVPNATVRVQVDSVSTIGGLLGVTQPVVDQTVQSDRNGYFSVAVTPRGALPIPGTRYDVRVTSTSGSQNAEERLTLIQRQG